jgi:hypothetical protein
MVGAVGRSVSIQSVELPTVTEPIAPLRETAVAFPGGEAVFRAGVCQ